ncbi:UTP--glucose-1-phosphate uridylyltransferase GalU [Alicyclobacillus ferrooxydans]|uniref:UTP--glucose-1-phosphate uridylyltransferase n=1 Tax=Alicyclobacillus ferrooxydans TaxID=471514 RepID=A0A0P9CAL0_9BACL|nr:UTP--glucose-1-phosphate uridylyltransferase GalU [Alicyclobacillus ferrooxydans]KPV42442.1 UTP--glucose-1-phosphate uridylyltransferase [Alicyclobacillus ferrooxydans]
MPYPKVKKAVIPAAGLGTRFLPATKAMPKEMLPIVDKPTIQYILEEAIASGIEDIILVTGKGKRAIEDHFDRTVELEEQLISKGKNSLLKEIEHISSMARIHYIRQKHPLGLGHAVWVARRFIGNEPFAVLLGDDIVQGNKPCLKQLMDVYDEFGQSVVAIQEVARAEVHRYGIVDGDWISDRTYKLRDLIEKPSVDEAPSNLAITGRYILTPEIFPLLEGEPFGVDQEIQLTGAIRKLTAIQGSIAYRFEGYRFDVGEKMGYIRANLETALRRPELAPLVRDLMSRLLKESSAVTTR